MRLRLLFLAALAWRQAFAADTAGPRRGVDLPLPPASIEAAPDPAAASARPEGAIVPALGPQAAVPPAAGIEAVTPDAEPAPRRLPAADPGARLFDGRAPPVSDDAQAVDDLALLGQTALGIERAYVDPVRRQDLYHSALRALIRESGHAADPEASRRLGALRRESRTLSQDLGIDAERLIDGSIVMRAVDAGSVAERAGLRSGDRLVLLEDPRQTPRDVLVGERMLTLSGERFADMTAPQVKTALHDFVFGGRSVVAARRDGERLRPVRLKAESYDARAMAILKSTLRDFGGRRQRPAALAALRGFTRPLDPHTVIVPARAATYYMDELKSEHSGIGITLKPQGTAAAVVDSVTPGTPADRAGIQAGDVLRSVDGKGDGDREALFEALRAVRESAARKVRWVFARPQADGPARTLAFDLENEPIAHRHAFAELLPGERGYIHLGAFGAGSADELIALYEDLLRRGARELILDLRFNGGGLGSEAQKIASLFLPPGTVLMEVQGRASRQLVLTDGARPPLPRLPLKILINRYSASASEVLAGALRHHGVARLYGERSHGKGSGQNTAQLDGGALLKITTGRWRLPSGRLLDHRAGGLDPDVAVPTVKARLKPLFMSLYRRLTGQPQPEAVDDPVLRRALEDAP